VEALFGVFHVGDVGVGVAGGRRRRQFGRLVVSWTCGALEVWVLLPELRDKENPINRRLQGLEDDVEVAGGWRSSQIGRLGVSWMWRVGWSVFFCQSTQEF